MLEMRAVCERCNTALPHDADARICSYECTFCADCVENTLHNVCPNCGGGFAPRPIRPQRAWREGAGLATDPPDTQRRSLRYSLDEVTELVEKLRDVPAAER